MATAAPAKSDTPPPAEAAPAAAPAEAAPKGGGLKSWLPTIVALLLAPAACWAVAQYVLMPQLKRSLLADVAEESADAHAPAAGGTAPAAHGAPAGHGAAGGHGKEGEGAAATNVYRFDNVVVNLAGTMGTRYLKTSFIVAGTTPELAARFEGARPQLVDVTLGVLSTLTLAELEEPGAKNVIREKLVNSYNQVLGQRVAEQVYFADFVVQ